MASQSPVLVSKSKVADGPRTEEELTTRSQPTALGALGVQCTVYSVQRAEHNLLKRTSNFFKGMETPCRSASVQLWQIAPSKEWTNLKGVTTFPAANELPLTVLVTRLKVCVRKVRALC